MQIIEIRQDNKRAVAKAEETNQMFESINRQLYKIDEKEMSFEVTSELVLDDTVFAGYVKRLQAVCKAHKIKGAGKKIKGLNLNYLNDDRPLNGLEIDPGCIFYSDFVKENKAFSIIGKLMLDIKIFRFDKKSGQQVDKESLNFSTVMAHPQLWLHREIT